jgi:hypothetical protein
MVDLALRWLLRFAFVARLVWWLWVFAGGPVIDFVFKA